MVGKWKSLANESKMWNEKYCDIRFLWLFELEPFRRVGTKGWEMNDPFHWVVADFFTQESYSQQSLYSSTCKTLKSSSINNMDFSFWKTLLTLATIIFKMFHRLFLSVLLEKKHWNIPVIATTFYPSLSLSCYFQTYKKTSKWLLVNSSDWDLVLPST